MDYTKRDDQAGEALERGGIVIGTRARDDQHAAELERSPRARRV